MALTQPDAVAGVIALSGRILPEIHPQVAPPAALQGLPVFLGQGVLDRLVPIEKGRASHAWLSTFPVDLSYREYPIDHEISAEEFADLTAWLAARLPPI